MIRKMTGLALLVAIALVMVPAVWANPGDWNRTIDLYEEMLDSLMAAQEKLERNPQDMTALTELTNANMQAMELAQRLEQAQGQLTPQQLMRFMEVYQKYMQWAASRM